MPAQFTPSIDEQQTASAEPVLSHVDQPSDHEILNHWEAVKALGAEWYTCGPEDERADRIVEEIGWHEMAVNRAVASTPAGAIVQLLVALLHMTDNPEFEREIFRDDRDAILARQRDEDFEISTVIAALRSLGMEGLPGRNDRPEAP